MKHGVSCLLVVGLSCLFGTDVSSVELKRPLRDYTEEEQGYLAAQAGRVFTVAIEGAENVTTFTSEYGKGLDYKILDFLSADLGIRFQVFPQKDIPSFVKAMAEGTYDLYIGPNESPARRRSLLFLPDLFAEPYYVYVDWHHSNITNLYEMGKHKLGVLDGDYIVPLLESRYKIDPGDLVFFKTRASLAQALLEGKVEGIVSAIAIDDLPRNLPRPFRLTGVPSTLAKVSVNIREPLLAAVVGTALERFKERFDPGEVMAETEKEYLQTRFFSSLNDADRSYLDGLERVRYSARGPYALIDRMVLTFSRIINKPLIKVPASPGSDADIYAWNSPGDATTPSNLMASDLLYWANLSAIGRPGADQVPDIQSLEGLRLGLVKGSKAMEWVEGNPAFQPISLYETFPELVEALNKNIEDYGLLTDLELYSQLTAHPSLEVEVSGVKLFQVPVVVYFRAEEEPLLRIFNKFLSFYYVENKEYSDIMNRMQRTFVDHRVGVATQRAVLVLVGLVVALAIVYLYFRMLRLRKKERIQLDFVRTHDPATGLLNYCGLQEEIERLGVMKFANKSIFAYDFTEIRRFFDILGEDGGGRCLTLQARIIQEVSCCDDSCAVMDGPGHCCSGAKCVMGRVPSGHLIVVLYDYQDHRCLDQFLRKIRRASGQAERQLMKRITMHVFTGVKIVEPTEDWGSAVNHALMASYYAAFSGKAEAVYYSREVEQHLLQANELEAELLGMKDFEKIEPVYQLIYHTGTKSFVGAEALARWRSSEEVRYFPDQFVPVIDRLELTGEFTKHLIRRVIADLPQLTEKYGSAFYVTVNLSAAHDFGVDLIDDVAEELERSGLQPGTLRFEITESALVKDFQKMSRFMGYAAKRGFKILLDDFGTGYSSLSYLNKLNFDVVKIDRSFISGLPGTVSSVALVETILQLSARLGFDVVAEGIETPEQVYFFLDKKAVGLQGYYFCTPRRIEDLLRGDQVEVPSLGRA